MMMNTTLAQLRDLKLAGMVAAIEEQLSAGAGSALCFEERLALMVDREVHHRSDKRRAGLLKRAQLKYPQACIEDFDARAASRPRAPGADEPGAVALGRRGTGDPDHRGHRIGQELARVRAGVSAGVNPLLFAGEAAFLDDAG